MTVRILGPNDPALEALQRSIENHPEIDAVLTIVPWEDYRSALDQTLAVYEYDAVFIPGHIWMPQLVEDGKIIALEDLRESCSKQVLGTYHQDDVFPSIQNECTYVGKQYMLPLFTDGHILFYRSDLVKFPKQVMLSKMSDLLQNFDLPTGVRAFAQKAHSSEIFLDFLPYFWEFGAELIDAAGNPMFDSEAAVKALTYYRDLRKFCPENTADYGNGEIVTAITTGECASVISWGGQAAAIFQGSQAIQGAEIKTAAVQNAWNATWGVCLPANLPADRSVMVLESLLALMGPDCDGLVTEIAGSPVRMSSYSDEALAKYGWLSSQKDLLQNCKTLPTDPEFGKYLGALYAEVHNAFTWSKTPKQALQDALTP